MPSFILIRPTVWPQYTNVTDRTDRQTDRTGEEDDPIVQGKSFYKRSPKNLEKLAATLRASGPGVQSASLIMTSLMTW